MNLPVLMEGAALFGLRPDEQATVKFATFMEELKRWNRSINLTAIRHDKQIILKHFIDSIAIAPHIPDNATMLDVGSGAGFPSIAVAIMRPDLRVTSIDTVDKKARFQRHICRVLRLDNVTVLHGRVEELSLSGKSGFDIVTSRAFSDVGRFAELASHLVAPGGLMLPMLGANTVITDDKLKYMEQNHGLFLTQKTAYSLPEGAGKRLILAFRRNSP